MALTTVAVSIVATYFTGAPMANGHVRFELTGSDADGTLLVPQGWDVPLDANATATANLWPNGRGTNGTQYRVTFYDYAGALQYSGVCTVPPAACVLHTILSLAPPASVSDAQTASSAAQAYAAQALAVLADPGFIAVKNDLPNIDAVAASAAGIDTTAANIAAINAAPGNAAAAAASAAAAAASAGSVGATAIYQGLVQVLGLFGHNHASAVATNTQNFNSGYVPLMVLGAI